MTDYRSDVCHETVTRLSSCSKAKEKCVKYLAPIFKLASAKVSNLARLVRIQIASPRDYL